MSHKKIPVIAAIPNYNMASSLKKLLPQVLEQGYDEIFVLDDASTDNSQSVAKSFKTVKFVSGQKNAGSGANRNRITPELKYEAIIHFIDADVQLKSQNNPDKIRKIFNDNDRLGFAGGLIEMPDGTPWMFNYGPRYSWFSSVGGWFQARVGMFKDNRPKYSGFLNLISGWRYLAYPNPAKTPKGRYVFWVGEANLIVPSKLYAAVGGFDEKLLYHEIQDLATKIHHLGYKAWFEPSIVVVHPQIDLPKMRNEANAIKAERYLRKKYGFPLK